MHGKDLSPAFYFANQGYDVYLGNNRGTKYSWKHDTIHPKEKRFWQYSFVDLAKDIKAKIEFILQSTGVDKVAYIGHS